MNGDPSSWLRNRVLQHSASLAATAVFALGIACSSETITRGSRSKGGSDDAAGVRGIGGAASTAPVGGTPGNTGSSATTTSIGGQTNATGSSDVPAVGGGAG